MFRRLSRFAGRRRFRSAEGRRNEQVPECGQPLRGSPHRPSEYLPLQFIAACDLRSSDAAGGYADGETRSRLSEQGISIYDALAQNDSYHALQAVGGLIITGPTGTNVNDLSVGLIHGE